MQLIEACRAIVAEHQHGRVREQADGSFAFNHSSSGGHNRGWTIIDAFSASAYVAVHDGLSPENRVKLQGMGLRGIHVALKLLK